MQNNGFALTEIVDLADHDDLFELLDNESVYALSHQGITDGFSSVKAISRSTGIETRRLLQPQLSPIDIAAAIAEKLQSTVGFEWADCPAIMLCHSHTNHDSARQLCDELSNILRVPSKKFIALNYGCVGFVELLKRAAELLENLPERVHIPLLTVETPEHWHDSSDKAFCGIVSAGATGTTLWKGPGHSLLHVETSTEYIPAERRKQEVPLFWTEQGDMFDFRGRPEHKLVMHMDGESVFLNGVDLMLEACLKSYEQVAGQADRILIAPHQPSGKLLKAMIAAARQVPITADYLNNLPFYGNSISSTIPTILARLEEVVYANGYAPVNDGDVILLPAAGICMNRLTDSMCIGRAAIQWQPSRYENRA
ncbi:beta-ketoacyl-[acyl-carrier-protein] synthase family protein [Gimesia aquarii]|uniref:3-oxoacyl-(Acyl carrier protein) synthase III n=1 Tax=Gimesia aquarii TaxID=2527964 RepID=A0A517VQ64_9PLAN|nr:hypothetical protein [Gimesia aquarii]QDT95164.1 3-oxoacyl-(acyl carrier protein) synthase III [Gimesia aquarii]